LTKVPAHEWLATGQEDIAHIPAPEAVGDTIEIRERQFRPRGDLAIKAMLAAKRASVRQQQDREPLEAKEPWAV